MGDLKDRSLTDAEKKRLEKFKNKRGRRNPSKIPARLARTSAFAPKKTHLNTDSNFSRLYVVPGHSVIKVSGRELGSQHRDAIYAIFRLNYTLERVPLSPIERQQNNGMPFKNVYRTITTWRGLLRAMGKTEHTNNLMTLQDTLEAINKVLFVVVEGADQAAIIESWKRRDLSALNDRMNPGGHKKMLESINWNGLTLDSEVEITYGDWSANMMASAKLVSLNADVQFRLKSDYAKTFWPYIDSMNDHFYVDEEMLSALAGRDMWSEQEDRISRAQFRRETKRAFEDMVKAGGLSEFRVEITGVGRHKSRRYYYRAKDLTQMELALPEPAQAGAAPVRPERARPLRPNGQGV